MMATTTIIPLHIGKGRTIATALGLSVDYVENPDKTDGGEWVTSYACDLLTVDAEFMFSKNQYATITGRDQGARDVIGYHLRISFKPGETDAATANRIGYELAMKLTHGNHAFVCCTHTDKAHVHTHIVFNSTSIDVAKKFRNFKGSSFAVRRIADHLCIENGLSIVTNPQPSKGTIYAKDKEGKIQPTGRDRLRELMDKNIVIGNSLTEFITKLKRAGVEVKHGKQVSFRPPGSKRFFRQDSLGEDYSYEAILEKLRGTRNIVPRKKSDDDSERKANEYMEAINRQSRPNLLIDIQAKLMQGYGEGYETWARIFNIKQMARTLIFLQENGIDSYDDLAKKSAAASSEYHERLTKIKVAETRLAEISELQKQIGTYGKTREVYKMYRASGRDQAFYDVNATEIILHEAAKKYFDRLGYGKDKKLPSINMLKQEYATLLAEKKKLYSGWNELKENRKALLVAKGNADRILGIGKDEAKHITDREPKRNHSHVR